MWLSLTDIFREASEQRSLNLTSLPERLEGSSLHLTLLLDADAYVAQRISCQLLATNEVKRQAKRMGQMCPAREYPDFVLVVTVTWPYGIRCGLKTA